MKTIISIFISVIFTNKAYSQDTIPKKTPVFSIGIRNAYAILPYNFYFSINSFNLKNNLSLSYNSYYNVSFVKRPGFQLAYNYYFFKKMGLFSGIGLNYIYGQFSFGSDKVKYIGSTYFKNLEYLNINCGYFYRFYLGKFGILEPAITLTYIQPIKSIHYDYFHYNMMPRFIPNLEVKFYFKRNKKQNKLHLD